MANQLDPQIVNLTKAIRQTESGGNFQAQGASGEYGAYQFTAPTWANLAGKYLGNSKIPLNQATPEQQNEVAYKQIADWKAQGNNVGQISSMWNAGESEPNAYLGTFSNGKPAMGKNSKGVSFDVPAYAKSVAIAYQTLKNGGQVSVDPNNPSSVANQPQAPSVGGFLTNAVSSAGNVIGGLANAVMHPIKTATTLLSTAAGAVEGGLNATGATHIDNQDVSNFNNLVSVYGKRYGGSSIGEVVKNIGNTLYTDPVGAALDLSTILDGAGAVLGKVGKISDIASSANAIEASKAADFISTAQGLVKTGTPEAIKALSEPGMITKISNAVKIAGDYTNPIKPILNATTGALGLAGKAVGYTASKIIGEEPGVLADLVRNPQDYSKAAIEATSRGGLATELGNAIDAVAETKSTTGAEYNSIRNSSAVVNVIPESIQEVFQKHGLSVEQTVDNTGKITWKIGAPTADTTLSSADISHFQKFLDQFGETKLKAGQLLNAKSVLSEYSNYEGKTNASTALARDLRGVYENAGDTQVPGLKNLDERMAPQISQWKQIKKDFLTKDAQTGEWVLKDGAANKIANAVNKPGLIKELEGIMPGITRKIEILKNVESIEKSMGIKVGTYTKTLVEGGALVTGNIPLAIGMIIAHPSIANEILRGFGYISKAAVMPILAKVRALLGALPSGLVMSAAKVGTIVNTIPSKEKGKSSIPKGKGL